MSKAQQALDRMADNARELGLDYEPAQQEPVAYLCENAVGHKYFRWKKPSSTYKPIALYTSPPAQQEPVAWRNAALRVGEDLCSVGPFGYYDMTAEQWLDWALSVVTVHAPPAQQEPVAWKLVPTKPTEEMLKAMDECSKEGYDERLYAGHAASVYMAAVDAAPTPPAQRKPLTDEEIKLVMDGRGEEGDDDYVKPAFDPFGISEDDLMNFARAIEAKLKEKNNG